MDKIIEFKDTNFAYNGKNSFNDFNMEIEEGDIVTLIGPTGSGKTTLLKMLCHVLPNDTCYYYGKNFKECDIERLKREVVVVFDLPINSSTLKDEIVKYLKKLGIPNLEIEDKYMKFKEYFRLENFEHTPISKLNFREKNLVKILRYLIIEPKFIAFDNILSNVDIEDKNRIFSFIKEKKISVLNVTSDLNDSLYGNKICVLENFVLILEGSTMSVLKTDTLLKRLGFKLPLAVDLSIELNHYSVLKNIYNSSERLVRELWR